MAAEGRQIGDRFHDIGLALTVGADENVDARLELDREVLVVAEVGELEAEILTG